MENIRSWKGVRLVLDFEVAEEDERVEDERVAGRAVCGLERPLGFFLGGGGSDLFIFTAAFFVTNGKKLIEFPAPQFRCFNFPT